MSTSTTNIQDLLQQIVSGNQSESAAAKQLIVSQNTEAVPTLLELLPQANERQCWAILTLLAKIGDKRAVPSVIQCLYMEHRAIQGIAAQCLGELGDVRAVAPLTDVLVSDPESSTTVWLVQALGKIGDVAAVETLMNLIASTDSAAVRYTAIEALGLIGDIRAIPVIMNYVADENRHIRSRAIAAIEAFRSSRMVVHQFSIQH